MRTSSDLVWYILTTISFLTSFASVSPYSPYIDIHSQQVVSLGLRDPYICMSQASGQNRSRSQQYRVYDESLISQDPIPFVTARRFWVLVYMLLGSTGVAMLLARVSTTPSQFKAYQANGIW